MEKQDLKEDVLVNLRCVTQSCKGGVPIDRLNRDYKDFIGESIPLRELGYNSLKSFIEDNSHVITLQKNQDGVLVVEGVADESTKHIVSLVSRQKAEVKKKGYYKPSQTGMRKTLSSRWTFREGARGSHSQHSAYSSRSTLSKMRLQPPDRSNSQFQQLSSASERSNSQSKLHGLVQHSKSRSTNNQVLNREKYEVAPRFLKVQNQARNSPPPSQELAEIRNSSLMPEFSDENYDVYPLPKFSVHNLPEKSRTTHLQSLESVESAKEYIETYASIENITFNYSTALLGQKKKGYVSTLYIGDKSYKSYPNYKDTKEEAEELAASKAMAVIKSKMKEQMIMYPETPHGNPEEIKKLLTRIEEIVCEKPSGMYETGIVLEYENKFNEKLPSCWPELLKDSVNVVIEDVAIMTARVPKGANFIVYKSKEPSSGNRTPSSTSSKTEFSYDENLNTSALKKNLVNISLPKVPDIQLPSGNLWNVYVTTVGEWFSVRLLDYYDDFLALSEEMIKFYKTKTFPVVDVFEYQVYAAQTDENFEVWHRVLTEEIKEDGQVSCYLLDEGDFAYCTKENLQEINPDFLKLPFQAIHISLVGLESYEKCIKDELLERILGKTLIAEVQRSYKIPEIFPNVSGMHRTIHCVTLYDTSDPSDEDLNLNKWLEQHFKESFIFNLPKLSTSCCAYLSHVNVDGKIYMRLTNPAQCWIEQELEKLVPTFEETSLASSKISANTIYVAKCMNGSWQRANIVTENLQSSNNTEMIEVFFVDYGNVDVVRKLEICELDLINKFLASMPPQAICCELLNALPPGTDKWTEAATAKLLELAPFYQELIIRVMSEGDGKNLPKVNLYKRDKDSNIISINDSLAFVKEFDTTSGKVPSNLTLQPRKSSLKSNLSGIIPDVAVSAEAKRLASSFSMEEWLNTPDDIKTPGALDVQFPLSIINLPDIPNVNEYFDVFVTMAAHPHNFIVQPYSSCKEMNKLMMDMQNFYFCDENHLDMELSMLFENQYYAALHSDNSWYRVRIEKITASDPVMVAAHYVDFGDFHSLSIDCLQPLYQQFKQLPCQAIQASLAGVRPFESDWDPVQCVTFREMVTEKSFVSVIKQKDIQEKVIPTLFVELTLIDTHDLSGNDIYIHEVLIEKNIAKAL